MLEALDGSPPSTRREIAPLWAELERHSGNVDAASEHATTAIRLGIEHRSQRTVMDGLRELALTTVMRHRKDEATRAGHYLGAALYLHDVSGIALGALEAQDVDALVTKLRETLGPEYADAAIATGRGAIADDDLRVGVDNLLA